jgi:gamma-glutamyltranspeptidase/glutathione hydrolase
MREVFLDDGAVPRVGSVLRQKDLATTLRRIASDGPDALYGGELGQRLVRFMVQEKGLVTLEDLIGHSSTWQEPIWTPYMGYRVGAFPPNSQGVALLMQMNMAERFELRPMGHNSAAYVRTLTDITKLAFRERDRYVSDPAFTEVPLEKMVSKDFARDLLSGSIAPPRGVAPRNGDGDTVFLCVIDKDGNAVSMIQSLFNAWGSGRMIPGTGVVLHNRGGLFELDSTHVNVVAPGKRTYHTLAPAIALRSDGSPFMVFGTPGSDGQTQTQLQIFHNILMFGMTPQQAVEAPRWRIYEGGRIQLEPGFPDAVRTALEAAGNTVTITRGLSSELGGAQIIMVDAGPRVLWTAADPRREAYGIAW